MVATSSIIKYNSKTVLETALQYAAFGWRVIPLHYPVFDAATGECSRCSCSAGKDCDKPGKHPRISEWPKNATTDGQIIGEWFGASNKTNIGIAAGKNSDLLVLDVDGQEGVSSVKGRAGLVTPTAKTGNGYHLFFKYPSDLPPETLEIIRRNKVRFLPGLDFRGDGGQVVAPPSRHYSGSYYSWRNPPAADFMPAACPGWLIDALVEAASKTKVGQADASRGKIIQMPGTVKVEASERTAKREKAYCEAALNAACERVKNAVSGTRNDTLFKAVAGVAALLHYGHITEADIYYQFNNAASGAGLKEHETKQTMRSAMDTGRSLLFNCPVEGD